jgi:hypothetical protein
MLIELDPASAFKVFGLPSAGELHVRREAVKGSSEDRVDLAVHDSTEQLLCIIECKVGADVDVWQLQRYSQRWSDAGRRILISLVDMARFLRNVPGWTTLSWLTVMQGFETSANSVVAQLGSMGSQRIAAELGTCNHDTQWNSPSVSEWAKLAWLSEECHVAQFSRVVLGKSTTSAPLLSMDTDPTDDGYCLNVEFQDAETRRRDAPRKGPMARLMLTRSNVTTSEAFDWVKLKTIEAAIDRRTRQFNGSLVRANGPPQRGPSR